MKIFRTNSLVAVLRGLSAIMVIFFFVPVLAYGQGPVMTRAYT